MLFLLLNSSFLLSKRQNSFFSWLPRHLSSGLFSNNQKWNMCPTGMKPTRLFIEFLNSEKAGGLILVFATIISLIIANSAWQSSFSSIQQADIGGHSVVHWINDGLMTVFFLLIGLELEREIYAGELSNLKKASLPVFAAVGGMLVPFALYLSSQFRNRH